MAKQGKFNILQLNPADIIVPEGQNARRTFEEKQLFALARSMESTGQINPIHVNQIDGKYFLIAGERRVRAAIEEGIATVECRVHEDLDAMTIWKIRRAENHHRVSLNAIEEAMDYRNGIEAGMTIEEIADSEEVTVETVGRRLKLLELNEEVQRMIVRDINPLPIHQALLLGRLDESKQIELARQAAPIAGEVASERQVREWVETEIKGRPLEFEDDDKNERKDTGLPRETGFERAAKAGHEKQTQHDKTADSKKTKPGDAASLIKPIEARIGITGKIGLTEANITISKATVVLNLSGKVKTIAIAQLTLDVPDASFKELGKTIKAAAKKDSPSPAGNSKKDKSLKK